MHLLDLARPRPEPAEEHAGEGAQEPLWVVRGAVVYLGAAGVLVDVLPSEHAPVHPHGGAPGAFAELPVVVEAPGPQVAGGAAGDVEGEGDQGVEAEAAQRHQPLPHRAPKIQHRGHDLGRGDI